MASAVAVSSQVLPSSSSCSHKCLLELAGTVSEQNNALSFYFGAAGAANSSHQEEHIRFQELVAHDRAQSHEAELNLIKSLEVEVRAHPRRFRAAFISEAHGILRYINLPLAGDIELLHFDRHFELVPLVRALEAASIYVVVLIENGKARGFTARGDEIEERKDLFPAADINPHPEDERVGWPHHVEANADERLHRFFRDLAERIREYAARTGATNLLVGCRNGVWSKLEPELTRIRVNHTARFPMTSFESSPASVLQESKRAWFQMKEREYDEFWQALIEDPSRSAIGIDNVLQRLEEGRVRRLFLGAVPETESLECAKCGTWLRQGTAACQRCGADESHSTPTAELLLRKALASGADVLAPPTTYLDEGRVVGALLRY